MSYGGTREWRLWFRRDETQPWRMLGPGYCYKTEESANAGRARKERAFPSTQWMVARGHQWTEEPLDLSAPY